MFEVIQLNYSFLYAKVGKLILLDCDITKMHFVALSSTHVESFQYSVSVHIYKETSIFCRATIITFI